MTTTDDLPYVHDAGLAAWIGERLPDIPADVIHGVLALEFDYLVASGIAHGGPPGYEPWYYKRDANLPRSVDTATLARDAALLFGIAEDIAHEVFCAEFEYMQMRGLA